MTRKAKVLTGFWVVCCLAGACGTAQAVIPVLAPVVTTLFTAILPAVVIALGGLFVTLFKPSTMKAIVKVLWRQKIAVVIVIAGVVGLVYLWGAVSSALGPAVKQAEASTDTYTMFRGNAARTGVSGSYPDPVAGNVNWTYSKDVKTFYSSPAVVGNRVYVTSSDKGAYTDRGAIYCLDADTGGVVWKVAPRGYVATFSSPAISGKYLVVGEGLHWTSAARIVCLDLTKNGEIAWQFQTKSTVESSPCIYNNRVYVGATTEGYYCLELEPGPGGAARKVWNVQVGKVADAESPPVAADGKVYMGMGREDRGICCLDANTGKEIWKQETWAPVLAPPTLVQGKIIVGMGNANFIDSEEEVRDKELKRLKEAKASPEEIKRAEERYRTNGEVWCLDGATGAVQWKFNAGRSVLGAIAAVGDRLYFGSFDHNLYCISMAGKLIGKWDAHVPIVSSPAATKDHVYVVTQNGMLYCLGADDLQPVWEVTLGTSGRFLSSPTVARGHVYVGSETEGLLCVGVPATMKKEPVWAGLLGGPGAPGQIDGGALPDKGVFAWRYPARSEEDNTTEKVSVTGPCASLGDSLFVPTASASRQGLACLVNDPKGHDTPAERWFFPTANAISISPGAVGDKLFLVDGKRGDANRFLHCIEIQKGTRLWKTPVAAETSGEFLLEKDGVLLETEAGVLTRFALDGKEEWKEKTGALARSVSSAGTILIAAAENPPTLMALDSPTGKELWRVSLPARPTTSPAVREKTVLIGTTDGMTALSLLDGKTLWKGPPGEVRGTFLLDAGLVAYVDAASELVVLDLKGQPVGKPVEALAAVPPVSSRGAILYASKAGLMRYEPSQGEPALWMRTAWLGEQVSPMIMVNSQVLFATDSGLICAKGRVER